MSSPSSVVYCDASVQSFHSIANANGFSSFNTELQDIPNKNSYKVDVTTMVKNKVPHEEIFEIWLDSLNMNFYLPIFLEQGYNLETVGLSNLIFFSWNFVIARCSPEDLLSLGIKNPDHRKQIIKSISSWKISDRWPSFVPNNNLRLVLKKKYIFIFSFRNWLQAIGLIEYIKIFEEQNYQTVTEVINCTWEDFEDIGVKPLGHLKRFGLAIKKLKVHIMFTCFC